MPLPRRAGLALPSNPLPRLSSRYTGGLSAGAPPSGCHGLLAKQWQANPTAQPTHPHAHPNRHGSGAILPYQMPPPPPDHQPPQRLLIVAPSWIGDAVMATPTLRALRNLYPDTHITALVRRTTRAILDACPWVDRIVTARPKKSRPTDRRAGAFSLARRLAMRQFDTAILLPNSFRSALLMRVASIPRRVGYDRDGRGFLLTDRLLPPRAKGRFVPVSAHDYYLGIARYLGAENPDPTMQLFTRPEHDARAAQLLTQAGHDPTANRPLILINPGANYGDAKIWYPDRFAAVADRLTEQHNATLAVTGAPNERPILDAVINAAKHPILDLPALGVDLPTLKSVVRLADLMVTNDTGPRHIAAAFNVPVVTVFGPTDPAWTEINFDRERIVRVDVFCGPCQKKKCPLDHRCMTRINPDMVLDRAAELQTPNPPPP